MEKRHIFFLVAIVALGAFLRFYQITETPLGLYPDEAMNGNNALEAIRDFDVSTFRAGFKVFYPENNGREGFFINIQALALAVFGNEAWALRMVSAIFGTLTILGVYLLTKELFAGNLKSEAQNIKQIPNPNGQNSKRFGTFGFRISNLFRISRGDSIALLSSFFVAASYWHIHFSRIGFRAIMVPFFATFGLYFLLKGLRSGKILYLTAAGASVGLGFHTYIAFRFMPLVIAVPLIWYVGQWWTRNKNRPEILRSPTSRAKSDFDGLTCAPCAILLFLLITFIVALPIGYYFLQNPQDFLGRSGQVSVFSGENPLKEFAVSNLKTLGMFFWNGDCNWRHNYDCQPALHPIVAIFFLAGVIAAFKGLENPKSEYRNSKQIPNPNGQNSKRFGTLGFRISNLFRISDLEFRIFANSLAIPLLLAWLFSMSLPVTLTREGLPHALRAIGMIPPVMIIAGLGAWWAFTTILRWLEQQKEKWPQYLHQLSRIKREIILLFVAVLLFVPLATYRTYFLKWAEHPETYFAFSTDLLHLGQFLNALPDDIQKYVVVNLSGVDIRGIPVPAQTAMFATDTFRDEMRQKKNIVYVAPENIDGIQSGEVELPSGKSDFPNIDNRKVVITPLNGGDRALIAMLKQKFPQFSVKAMGDFVVFQNY